LQFVAGSGHKDGRVSSATGGYQYHGTLLLKIDKANSKGSAKLGHWPLALL
jgi:hypothetical protein